MDEIKMQKRILFLCKTNKSYILARGIVVGGE
jgi:hypothetical protein